MYIGNPLKTAIMFLEGCKPDEYVCIFSLRSVAGSLARRLLHPSRSSPARSLLPWQTRFFRFKPRSLHPFYAGRSRTSRSLSLAHSPCSWAQLTKNRKVLKFVTKYEKLCRPKAVCGPSPLSLLALPHLHLAHPPASPCAPSLCAPLPASGVISCVLIF